MQVRIVLYPGKLLRSPHARSVAARTRHSATCVAKRKASYANMVLVTTPQLLLIPRHVPRARARTPDNFFEVFNLCCFMLGFLPLLAFAISPPPLWRGLPPYHSLWLSTSDLKGPYSV